MLDAEVAHAGELFVLHADHVRRYAARKLWVYGVKGDRLALADDICSEVFACWLARLHRGRSLPPENAPSHQLAYLLVTARNLCADLAHGYERQRECERDLKTMQVTNVVTVARFTPLWPSLATLLALLRVALWTQTNAPGISTYERAGMLACMRYTARWEVQTKGLRHRWR